MKLALVGTVAVAGVHALPALAALAPRLRPALGIEDRVPAGAGPGAPAQVALTFDDGPHPRGTPAVLELLARRELRAVFFLVGEQVDRDPALAAEIAAAGHQIGLHCQRHRNLLRLAPPQVHADLQRAADTIARATGEMPALYRPPYGIANLAALSWARRHGLRTFLWTRWGRDWEPQATPASIVSLLTEGVRPRDVLLLHDADDYSAPGSWERTVAALPSVLDALTERGLGLATL
ncbi:MAG TPA: polysaccharide deacetylase family protein [Solirubrobacteraceae bacterium]|jgi:peptidoglycan/xylan/chitin deacetylase (PgdA/CDA1 family)|nr:polysaccharide deacetylase family protein [Solirubrobacteraceae bacterium]